MAFEDEVTADSPELWWDTRQAVGTSQPDRSENGHTGTITGSPTLDADGLTFDGSNHIESADIAPAAYASFALEAVVSPDVLTPYFGSIVDIFPPTLPGGIGLNCQDDGEGVLTYQGLAYDADDTRLVFNDPTLADPVGSGLQHLLLDFDGTDFTLYLDGVVYGTNTGTAFDVDFLEGAPFFLGDDFFGGDGYQGLIRHGVFYTHDLGPTRAAAHAAAALAPDVPPAVPGSDGRPVLKLDSDVGDLTAYGIDARFSIRRGGPPQQTGFVASAGTLSNALLDNISRDLDPLWTPGPFFGTLRRKIGTTATATWGATEYPLFVGRADDIPQSYPNEGVEQFVDLTATDLFAFLNNTPINTIRPTERTDQRFQAVLDSIDYPGPTDIQPGMSMVYGQNLQTVSALSHLGDVAQVEFGEFGIDQDGVLYFRGRPAITTDTRSTVVQAEYGQTNDGFRFVDVARGSLPIVNYVTLTFGKDGRQITVKDQDSIDLYDRQDMSVSLPFATHSQALSYGRWLLLLYAAPVDTFLSITFDLELTATPGEPFDLWAEIMSRREGDLVQITLDPLAGDELSGEPVVRKQWWRGVEIDFEAGRAVVALQDAWIDGLFYWDTSELDGPDFYGL